MLMKIREILQTIKELNTEIGKMFEHYEHLKVISQEPEYAQLFSALTGSTEA